MDRLKHKQVSANRRAKRVRSVVSGTSGRPRLAVSISNLHVVAQIIDDSQGKTLAYTTSVGEKVGPSLTDKAVWAGSDIAQKAKKAKVKKIVFDRSSRKYHGRVKALAEAAREGGLEF
jgi:large subunit ribosomal protein L18